MATEEKTQVSQAHMDERFDEMRGYIDTAVETLTAEMDRQFKAVRSEIQGLRKDMNSRMDTLESKFDTLEGLVRQLLAKP